MAALTGTVLVCVFGLLALRSQAWGTSMRPPRWCSTPATAGK